MIDLPTLLIDCIERADTRSAAVLARSIYALMRSAGVDVDTARRTVLEAILAERAKAAERLANSVERLTERAAREPELAAVVRALPADTVAAVRELLAQASPRLRPGDIAAHVRLDVGLVRAVRDLDFAVEARQKLKKKRKAKSRKERLLERIKTKVGWYSKPTKERSRQAGEGEQPTEATHPGGSKSYRYEWPVDQIKDLLPQPHYAAAERLRAAFDEMGGKSKIGAYGGVGGVSDPARRLALTPRQQFYARDYHELFRRLPGALLRAVVMNFVLEERWGGGERAMSFVEFGKWALKIDGPAQARGAAQGMLKLALEALAEAARSYERELNAQRREVYRAMGDAVIAAYIGDGDFETASGLLCRRLRVPAWLIQGCVRKAIKAAEEERNRRAHAHAAA